MIRRIVLDNYMAHAHTVIEPADGLTVLIGPNNCGKSAIVHALEMVCYNSDAADFAIRHGSKKAVVTIETIDPDGSAHTIQWWRTKNASGYVIDGREISGMRKGQIPDDLHKYLRMPAIESGGTETKFFLHFGLQKSPMFLVDDPPARAAQFFASATDADKLVEMQKNHQAKVTAAARDKRGLDIEIQTIDGQLEILSPLSELGEKLAALESAHQHLSKLAADIAAMDQRIDALRVAERTVAVGVECVKALSALHDPPALLDTEKLAGWIIASDRAASEAAYNAAAGSALTALQPPPSPLAVAELKSSITAIDSSREREAYCRGQATALSELKDPPLVDDTRELIKVIDDLNSARLTGGQWHEQTITLAKLPAVPDPLDVQPLKTAIAQLVLALEADADHRKVIGGVNKDIVRFRSDIERWIQDNPYCDACGQSITADLITSGAHAHE